MQVQVQVQVKLLVLFKVLVQVLVQLQVLVIDDGSGGDDEEASGKMMSRLIARTEFHHIVANSPLLLKPWRSVAISC